MPGRCRAGHGRQRRHRRLRSASSRTAGSAICCRPARADAAARPRPRRLDGPARPDRLPHPSRQGPHLAAHAEPDRRRAGRRRWRRAADRTASWNAEDVRARMEFGLETAYAKGVVAIRTHLDSLAPQAAISFPVFKASARALGRPHRAAGVVDRADRYLPHRRGRAARRHRGGRERQSRLRLALRRRSRTIRCRRSSTTRSTGCLRSPRSAASTSTCMSTNRAIRRRAR